MKTAICVQKHLDGWQGHASLYHITPAASYKTLSRIFFRGWLLCKTTNYVIVSATEGPMGDETFIFASDSLGNTKSMIEMNGSQRGTLSHETVLLAAGYLLVV